jgi:protein TonB
MKQFITILILICLGSLSPIYGQDEQIFINPEIQPSYPEGNEGLLKFIYSNFKYPQTDDILLTKIYFTINIDTLGIARFDSIQKLSEGADIEAVEKELTRIINLMPNWEPGRFDGKKVKTKMNIPLRLELK